MSRLVYEPGHILLQILCRVHAVNIFLIQLLSKLLHGFSKSLEMYNFSLTEEFDNIVDIGIIGHTKDVIISDPGLLLCCYLI